MTPTTCRATALPSAARWAPPSPPSPKTTAAASTASRSLSPPLPFPSHSVPTSDLIRPLPIPVVTSCLPISLCTLYRSDNCTVIASNLRLLLLEYASNAVTKIHTQVAVWLDMNALVVKDSVEVVFVVRRAGHGLAENSWSSVKGRGHGGGGRGRVGPGGAGRNSVDRDGPHSRRSHHSGCSLMAV